MQVSLDGFIAGPNGELDWMEWNWDDHLKDYVAELTAPVDTIIMGRKLAEGFIPYWREAAGDPAHPDFEGAGKMNTTPKIVFSKSMKEPAWENTNMANGKLVDEINAIKEQQANDIIVYGGAEFVSNLINENLIDQYHFFISPVAISRGLSVFRSLKKKFELRLVESRAFNCGIVVLHYQPFDNYR